MKAMKTFFALLILSCLLFQSKAFTQTPANKVDWSSFNMGFASPASASTVIKSAAGQAFAGAMQHGNTRIESGFLAKSFQFTTASLPQHSRARNQRPARPV